MQLLRSPMLLYPQSKTHRSGFTRSGLYLISAGRVRFREAGKIAKNVLLTFSCLPRSGNASVGMRSRDGVDDHGPLALSLFLFRLWARTLALLSEETSCLEATGHERERLMRMWNGKYRGFYVYGIHGIMSKRRMGELSINANKYGKENIINKRKK